MSFYKKLDRAWNENQSPICIGLDPDLNKIPKHLLKSKTPFFDFNKDIIDKTADLVCAYKPQIAYYSAYSKENELELTIDYIKKNYPNLLVILDAKRGDIGSTAKMYAKEVFERYKADAATVNPYMGLDTLKPFLEHKDKGVIVLCKTSNEGSDDFQALDVKGKALYLRVASKISEINQENIALVVGATYSQELKEVRSIVPDIPFLIPGIGAQGGNLKEALLNAKCSSNFGMLISSSRGIIYADRTQSFAEGARTATLKLKKEIEGVLNE